MILKTSKFFIYFFFLIKIVYSQTELSFGYPRGLFDDYDFDKGGYSLVIQPVKHSQWDTNFTFTDDINILNMFKKEYIVTKEAVVYPFACFDDYRILVCKNGSISTSYVVSRNCNSIGNYAFNFFFTPNGMIKRVSRFNKFNDRQEGIKYYNQVVVEEELIFVEEPDWLEYEGGFNFSYNSKEYDDDKIKLDLTKKISKIYPDEKFEISGVQSLSGSSETGIDYFVYVNCNKKLYDNFKLYRIGDNGWTAFPLILNTYWKR